ncbi:MAG TPA: K(+)-transporting ATPase subunit C, partial [Actinomycetota bacterium]|nr:K(+)-transporting ATPase subunit C [Actinomycetota bacterium]
MRRQLLPALRMTIALIVLLGLAYPLAMTGMAQAFFRSRADGSLTSRSGAVVGSGLIGQAFAAPQYFHPRPSAAGADGYDATASGASNLGPTNPKLEKAVADRARAYRAENGLAADAPVPVDAVTASASGLDPAISVANARDQAPRVARERAMAVDR